MSVKQFFNTDMVKAVQEYHLSQRDRHVRVVRWVCDPEGYSSLLVRFVDEQGEKVSSLMNCDAPCGPDDKWVVNEVCHTEREKEREMVQAEMAVSRFADDVDDGRGEFEWECEDEHKYIGDE